MKATKKSLSSILRVVLAVVQIVALSVVGTLSWIEGEMIPAIRGNDISLSVSEGLVLHYDGSSESMDVDLSEYENVRLVQVSSVDGQQFFAWDTKTYIQDENGDEIRVFKTATPNVDYFDISFSLIAQGLDAGDSYNIYFGDGLYQNDDGSYTSYETNFESNYEDGNLQHQIDAIRPLRVALAFDSAAKKDPIIFSKEGIEGPATAAVETLIETTNGSEANTFHSQVTHTFTEYTFYGTGDVNNGSPIHTLTYENASVTLFLRVWLEGGCSFCTDENTYLPGSTFNLNLFFMGTKTTGGA